MSVPMAPTMPPNGSANAFSIVTGPDSSYPVMLSSPAMLLRLPIRPLRKPEAR